MPGPIGESRIRGESVISATNPEYQPGNVYVMVSPMVDNIVVSHLIMRTDDTIFVFLFFFKAILEPIRCNQISS